MAKEKGKRIAVVGCGPAGMHAALILSREGNAVEIFEKEALPGGMLQYYLPKFRFSRDKIVQKAENLQEMGVKIHYSTAVGKDLPLDKLAKEFDAVVLAPGAWKARELELEGSGLEGVVSWFLFLREYNDGKIEGLEGKKVVVIGAGDTAMDCARAAKKLGAESFVAYRKGKENMRANKREIEGAEKDGVEFLLWHSPVSFKGEGKLNAVEFDKKGENVLIEADMAITAIGQIPDARVFEGSECSVEALPDNVVPAGDIVNENKLIATAITSASNAVQKIKAIIDN